jgi:transposase InsO family protein
VPSRRLRAERCNQVWALDFTFDSTSDGRPLKALSMCDEHTRENVGRQLGRSLTAADVVEVMDQAKAKAGAREYIRMDNGPELTATTIRDWCRLPGTGTIYIEPGSRVSCRSTSAATSDLQDCLDQSRHQVAPPAQGPFHSGACAHLLADALAPRPYHRRNR